jgi:hypothetical protein
MSINKPFHRNYRKLKDGFNAGYSDWAYIIDHEYAINPHHYTRAFSIIQEDLLKMFEFIEPADTNNTTYSFRIHELFMRTCIEIESNFKAILRENTYTPIYKKGSNKGNLRLENKWTIDDFKIINKTHHLDEYIVELPFWKGENNFQKPFEDWKLNEPLKWYQAYNKSKHDRLNNFHEANFENLILAFSALFVLLSSQFRTESFAPGITSLGLMGGSYYKGTFGLGDFLMVQFPKNWDDSEIYEFNWTELSKEKERFSKIDYNLL